MHMATLNPPVELEDSANVESFKFVQSLYLLADYDFPQCFYFHIKRLWSDAGVQECYRRSNEFFLIESSKYFLDQIDAISDESYIPTDQDIPRCRRRTTNVKKVEFEATIPKKYGHGIQEFWMFDVGGQRGERRKWFSVFAGIDAVAFSGSADQRGSTLCSGEDSTDQRGCRKHSTCFVTSGTANILRGSGSDPVLEQARSTKGERWNEGSKIEDHFPAYKCFKAHKG
uniref:Putative g protein n=1 Tax=Ixodes ricinus TaxID=34613 RepID=A0A090XCG5_IXORI